MSFQLKKTCQGQSHRQRAQVPATVVQGTYLKSILIAGFYFAPVPEMLSTFQADGVSLLQEQLSAVQSKSPADTEELP